MLVSGMVDRFTYYAIRVTALAMVAVYMTYAQRVIASKEVMLASYLEFCLLLAFLKMLREKPPRSRAVVLWTLTLLSVLSCLYIIVF